MISAADCTWPEFTFASLEDAEQHLTALKVSLSMAQDEGFKCGPLQDDILELEDLISMCRDNPNF